jgi:hypothetical protein
MDETDYFLTVDGAERLAVLKALEPYELEHLLTALDAEGLDVASGLEGTITDDINFELLNFVKPVVESLSLTRDVAALTVQLPAETIQPIQAVDPLISESAVELATITSPTVATQSAQESVTAAEAVVSAN